MLVELARFIVTPKWVQASANQGTDPSKPGAPIHCLPHVWPPAPSLWPSSPDGDRAPLRARLVRRHRDPTRYDHLSRRCRCLVLCHVRGSHRGKDVAMDWSRQSRVRRTTAAHLQRDLLPLATPLELATVDHL